MNKHAVPAIAIAFLLTLAVDHIAAENEVLTICQALEQRVENNGKVLSVRGRFEITEHGMTVSGNCEQPLATLGHVWPNEIALLPAQGREKALLDSEGIRREFSKAGAMPNQGNITIVTVTGRFETRETFTVYPYPAGKSLANGFGHVGRYAAVLHYRTMTDVRVRSREEEKKR